MECVTENDFCGECLVIHRNDCEVFTVAVGLANGDYWFEFIDQFGSRFFTVVMIAGGLLSIDPTIYPDGLITPYSGSFQGKIFQNENDAEPVTFTIAGTSYQCLSIDWSVVCCGENYVEPIPVKPCAAITVIDGAETHNVLCGDEYTCTGGVECDPVTTKNSDNTYNQSTASGGTLVLADETITLQLDGVNVGSSTFPAMTNPTILINWN